MLAIPIEFRHTGQDSWCSILQMRLDHRNEVHTFCSWSQLVKVLLRAPVFEPCFEQTASMYSFQESFNHPQLHQQAEIYWPEWHNDHCTGCAEPPDELDKASENVGNERRESLKPSCHDSSQDLRLKSLHLRWASNEIQLDKLLLKCYKSRTWTYCPQRKAEQFHVG